MTDRAAKHEDTFVIVCNNRYLVEASGEQPVGAASFVQAVSNELEDLGARVLRVGFKRDETLSKPIARLVDGHPCILFNFSMSISSVEECLRACVEKTCGQAPAAPRFWYQSGVFAPFHPSRMVGYITHHAPFVSELEERWNSSAVQAAFQGGGDKVDLLRAWQQKGLDSLRVNKDLKAVDFSPVQTSLLRKKQVKDEKIIVIRPRYIEAGRVTPSETTQGEAKYLLAGPADIRILCCCARIDGFKNLPQLIAAFNHLHSRGKRVRATVAAGSPSEEKARAALGGVLDKAMDGKVRIRPRFAQSEFLNLAALVGPYCFFVLPSVYETFGITALQANGCGMPVVLGSDRTRLGCWPFLDSPIGFEMDDQGALARVLAGLPDRQNLSVRPNTVVRESLKCLF